MRNKRTLKTSSKAMGRWCFFCVVAVQAWQPLAAASVHDIDQQIRDFVNANEQAAVKRSLNAETQYMNQCISGERYNNFKYQLMHCLSVRVVDGSALPTRQCASRWHPQAQAVRLDTGDGKQLTMGMDLLSAWWAGGGHLGGGSGAASIVNFTSKRQFLSIAGLGKKAVEQVPKAPKSREVSAQVANVLKQRGGKSRTSSTVKSSRQYYAVKPDISGSLRHIGNGIYQPLTDGQMVISLDGTVLKRTDEQRPWTYRWTSYERTASGTQARQYSGSAIETLNRAEPVQANYRSRVNVWRTDALRFLHQGRVVNNETVLHRLPTLNDFVLQADLVSGQQRQTVNIPSRYLQLEPLGFLDFGASRWRIELTGAAADPLLNKLGVSAEFLSLPLQLGHIEINASQQPHRGRSMWALYSGKRYQAQLHLLSKLDPQLRYRIRWNAPEFVSQEQQSEFAPVGAATATGGQAYVATLTIRITPARYLCSLPPRNSLGRVAAKGCGYKNGLQAIVEALDNEGRVVASAELSDHLLYKRPPVAAVRLQHRLTGGFRFRDVPDSGLTVTRVAPSVLGKAVEPGAKDLAFRISLQDAQGRDLPGGIQQASWRISDVLAGGWHGYTVNGRSTYNHARSRPDAGLLQMGIGLPKLGGYDFDPDVPAIQLSPERPVPLRLQTLFLRRIEKPSDGPTTSSDYGVELGLVAAQKGREFISVWPDANGGKLRVPLKPRSGTLQSIRIAASRLRFPGEVKVLNPQGQSIGGYQLYAAYPKTEIQIERLNRRGDELHLLAAASNIDAAELDQYRCRWRLEAVTGQLLNDDAAMLEIRRYSPPVARCRARYRLEASVWGERPAVIVELVRGDGQGATALATGRAGVGQ